ncbi:MAG TPA: nucleotidyltransferase domain-containing protein [Acidimicrobiales bacterium]|nr:nucleotidyltransferase domain-containing protein [Acidimicrobiales bacterium]
MDYLQPIEAVIPGVQGRVLGVLSRSESEMTIRTVARLAGASAQQTSVLVGDLLRLGIVSRREAGSSALIALNRTNEAARLIATLGDVRHSVIQRLRGRAKLITPAPTSLVVFGSFARGEARAESDLDVLAVCPKGVAPDDAGWVDSLGAWESSARQIGGNAISTIVVGESELPSLLRRRSGPWSEIVRDGVALIGPPLADLAAV